MPRNYIQASRREVFLGRSQVTLPRNDVYARLPYDYRTRSNRAFYADHDLVERLTESLDILLAPDFWETQTYPTHYAKGKLALLIAAHNEAVVIRGTLQSALESGMKPEDIYVVDDNSSDETSTIARQMIPARNVLKVTRSGKGLALTKASHKFQLTKRYRWIHIADADGAFSHDYFKVFRKSLRVENAAATGYIRSLPGHNVSQYRLFEYTIGMELHRRFQAMFNVIPVIPGPTSCFRADIFERVDFANKSLTEDLDVTLQIHRGNMGKIQFIPQAIAYTQDPLTVKDFIKQITRWNRGVMQGVRRHKIGQHATSVDAYLSYQIAQNLLFFANYCIWIPYLMIARGSGAALAATFLYDVLITLGMTILVALRTGRWDVVSAFPFVYALRWVSLAVFLRSFTEVVILRKFKVTQGIWENNASRRYALPI